MSNFFLCDLCKHKQEPYVSDGVLYCEMGHRRAKAMIDHGRQRGYADPYDDPLDVCEDFEQKGMER